MDVSLLTYPNKSHRKTIVIPPESKELAEIVGVIFGDGGINNLWQIVISLNSNKDSQYADYLSRLLTELFHIDVVRRKRPGQNTLVLVCSSTQLVDFFVEKGAVRGNKIQQKISIPEWVNINSDYRKAFVRGLVDTDGCLFIHKHIVRKVLYQNIGLCFTSYSNPLLESISNIFADVQIKHSIANKGRAIYIYSYKSVIKYLDIFGSSNPRITNVFDQWRGRLVA